MTVRSTVPAVSLVICSILMFVFVDGLQAVGRYDGGIKWLILQLPYASMLMAICAIPFLGRGRVALAIVTASYLLCIPLFVHECVPGLIGLFDPAYRASYGGERSVPFLRFDPVGCAAFALFAWTLACLLLRRRKAERSGTME